MNSRGIRDVNMKGNTMKILLDNIGKYLNLSRVGKYCLNVSLCLR